MDDELNKLVSQQTKLGAIGNKKRLKRTKRRDQLQNREKQETKRNKMRVRVNKGLAQRRKPYSPAPYTSHTAEHTINPGRAGSHAPVAPPAPAGAGPIGRGGSSGGHQTVGNIPNTKAEGIPEGLNYMEEQFVKYGNDLGNYKPSPIIGTDMMSSVYHNSETLTPAEYDYFFNWQHPIQPGGKKFARHKPKGISQLYDQTHLHAHALVEHERKFEYTRRHGGVIQNRTRFDEAPVFLSSG